MEQLTRYGALLDLIYQGATDPLAWPRIIEALAHQMDASKGILFTPVNNPNTDGFVFPYGISQSSLELWAARHQPADLWVLRSIERNLNGEGVVVLDKDLVTEDEFVASSWYQDFLIHMDIGRLLSGSIFIGDRPRIPRTSVSLFRSLSAAPYTEDDRSKLQFLLPHISRSIGVLMTLRDAEFRVTASQAGLDRLQAGVLLLDAMGTVSFANTAAKAILSARDGMSLRAAQGHTHPQLIIHNAESNQAVTAAVNMALARYMDVDFFHKAHVVPRPSGATPYSLQVSALSGQPCFGLNAAAPAAIVFIADPERGIRLDAQQLQNVYGLTPAEVKEAVQLLDGEDLMQLASSLDVGVNTVKTHVKKVYAKMGVNSRAAFVRAALSHSTLQVNEN